MWRGMLEWSHTTGLRNTQSCAMVEVKLTSRDWSVKKSADEIDAKPEVLARDC